MKNQARTSKPTLVPQIGGPLQPGTTGPVDTETLALLEVSPARMPPTTRGAQKELDEFRRAIREPDYNRRANPLSVSQFLSSTPARLGCSPILDKPKK